MGESISWIEWFLSFRGNEIFCAVDEDFISDRFNITGIGHDIPQFKKAYELISGSCGKKHKLFRLFLIIFIQLIKTITMAKFVILLKNLLVILMVLSTADLF